MSDDDTWPAFEPAPRSDDGVCADTENRISEYSSVYTTGNNPLPSVMSRKMRTLPASEADAE